MAPLMRARSAFPESAVDPLPGSSDLPPSDPPPDDQDEADDPLPGLEEAGGPSRIPLSEAVAAAENIPEILLRPPTDGNSASAPVSLFTPSCSCTVVHPLSDGSADASPAARPKRRRKQQPSPAPSPSQLPSPSGVTLRIPPRPHIPSILERLADSAPAPSPAESELRVLASAVAQKIDPSDPEVVASFKRVLSALVPGQNIESLLPDLFKDPPRGTAPPCPCLTFPSPALPYLTLPFRITFSLPYLTLPGAFPLAPSSGFPSCCLLHTIACLACFPL